MRHAVCSQINETRRVQGGSSKWDTPCAVKSHRGFTR